VVDGPLIGSWPSAWAPRDRLPRCRFIPAVRGEHSSAVGPRFSTIGSSPLAGNVTQANSGASGRIWRRLAADHPRRGRVRAPTSGGWLAASHGAGCWHGFEPCNGLAETNPPRNCSTSVARAWRLCSTFCSTHWVPVDRLHRRRLPRSQRRAPANCCEPCRPLGGASGSRQTSDRGTPEKRQGVSWLYAPMHRWCPPGSLAALRSIGGFAGRLGTGRPCHCATVRFSEDQP
jgi:hypothetical protein